MGNTLSPGFEVRIGAEQFPRGVGDDHLSATKIRTIRVSMKALPADTTGISWERGVMVNTSTDEDPWTAPQLCELCTKFNAGVKCWQNPCIWTRTASKQWEGHIRYHGCNMLVPYMPEWNMEMAESERWLGDITVMYTVCGRNHTAAEHLTTQDAIAKDPEWQEGQPPHVWYLAERPSVEHKGRWAGVADLRVREGDQWVIKR